MFAITTSPRSTATATSFEDRLQAASAGLRDRLLNRRTIDGHWTGKLSASALSTATAISALSFYLQTDAADAKQRSTIEQQIDAGLAWLQQQQNSDGGFGDTTKSYSNISTTMLVVAAIHAAGRADTCQGLLSAAESYIKDQGGIAGLRRRYGKDKTFAVPILANCAMAGIVDWKEVAALPFEAACVPQRFYHLMQLPVVSYAIPALVAIGQVKFHFDPPWDPIRKSIRKLSINRSLNVLSRMQPASGGYLEAVPLTSFVSMALIKSQCVDHSVVKNGIRFIVSSFETESADGTLGSWPIDTNLATWSTTLSINALANSPDTLPELVQRESDSWQACLDWLLQCQHRQVHPFTGSPPGGWGWTDLSGAVPDADDTPGALIALRNLFNTGRFDAQHEQIFQAAAAGVDWLLRLQNRDHGWPTFCRGWGKLPFDRSGADLTAHVIRGLLAWTDQLDQFSTGTRLAGQVERAIANGFGYLERQQGSDGSWLPLWFGNQDQPDDINPFYGTAKVLMAYQQANRFGTRPAEFGLNWILAQQNSDGGWGGGPSIQWPEETLGNSTVEETALCTEILLHSSKDEHQAAAHSGLDWLIRAAETNLVETSSPIGFYFAKLWYYEQSYPLIFATAALAQAEQTSTTTPTSKP